MEGFGLPGLEAMSSSCPVIASDIKVFREVYGDAAVYFNPKSSADLVKKITQVIKDAKLRGNMIQKGLWQVKRYSWKTLAKQTLKVYESV